MFAAAPAKSVASSSLPHTPSWQPHVTIVARSKLVTPIAKAVVHPLVSFKDGAARLGQLCGENMQATAMEATPLGRGLTLKHGIKEPQTIVSIPISNAMVLSDDPVKSGNAYARWVSPNPSAFGAFFPCIDTLKPQAVCHHLIHRHRSNGRSNMANCPNRCWTFWQVLHACHRLRGKERMRHINASPASCPMNARTCMKDVD